MTTEIDHPETPAAEGHSEPRLEIRRNVWLLAGVGVASALVAAAYLHRATGSGSALDWILGVVLGLVALGYLAVVVDARSPLLVADARGVRVRRGRTWQGLPWVEVDAVEHQPRSSLLRDGRLVVEPAAADAEAYAVPLGLSTRVSGAADGLDAVLAEIVPGAALVAPIEPDLSVEPDEADAPGASRWRDPRPAMAAGIGAIAERLRIAGRGGEPASATAEESSPEQGPPGQDLPGPGLPVAPAASLTEPAPTPDRQLTPGLRSDLVLGSLALASSPDQVTVALPEMEELRRPEFPGLEVENEPAAEELPEPVIGPQVAAARRRLDLTVEALAERTRIRQHVIAGIEIDDFGPCGGDFYARGHLRTLARVLGLEAAPLIEQYDQRYAHAPVTPRQVFEAELATGATASLRNTRGGPNWSVLVAALMAVVLAWSLARLVMDGPVDVPVAPRLDGSGGVGRAATSTTADAVPVVVRAAGGGAHVVVRDGNGRIIFTGDLAYGASRSLEVAPPVRVESSDGSVKVVVDGQEQGALGHTGQPATRTYVGD
ncbi:MAG: helix-turn-helix domain-containing protein [Nocardioides sp.]|uniref:helix-turn-helix domain-containing protein n=1 Tax=Nocardioides sp. TaxID=35761 RepID=UPI0039E27AA3